MSADKLSARELAKRLEDHAATHEIIFGKQCRSEEERQAAAELRRQDEAIAELVEVLEYLTLNVTEAMRAGGWVPTILQASFWEATSDVLAAIAKHKEARNG